MWGECGREKQNWACGGAPTLGSQFPSSEEETSSKARGNTARERWGRSARLPGETGKRAFPLRGMMRVGARKQVLLVYPESHFHLTMVTRMSYLGGHFCGLIRPTLCFCPLLLYLLPWLLHVEGHGLCCQLVPGHQLLPQGEFCPFCSCPTPGFASDSQPGPTLALSAWKHKGFRIKHPLVENGLGL